MQPVAAAGVPQLMVPELFLVRNCPDEQVGIVGTVGTETVVQLMVPALFLVRTWPDVHAGIVGTVGMSVFRA
jgi:hypothetical protein